MIRAYVNRFDRSFGPVIVEQWEGGQPVARTHCREVRFAGTVRMISVGERTGKGFVGWKQGYVHTWVEADAVAEFEQVTHTWGQPTHDCEAELKAQPGYSVFTGTPAVFDCSCGKRYAYQDYEAEGAWWALISTGT